MEKLPLRPSSPPPTRSGYGESQERLLSGEADVWVERLEISILWALLLISFVVLVVLVSMLEQAIINRLLRQSREQQEGMQVEAEILLAAVLVTQVLQLGFYNVRCRKNHWTVQWGAWAGYYVPMPLAAYAVGVMLQIQCPYWLVAFFFLAVNSDTMAAYSLQEDKQNLRGFAKRSLSLACLIVALLQSQVASFQRPKEVFSLLLGFLIFLVDIKISSRAVIPSSDLCMAAADHLRFQAPSTYPDEARARRIVVAVGSLGSYQSAVSGCTTYQNILDLNYSSKINDVCFSSALFLQLLQRCDMPQVTGCSSANFFFNDLLADDSRGYARAFKLVEVQLAFMYDYFFSVHGSPSSASYRLDMIYFISKIAFLLSVDISVPLDKAYSKPKLRTFSIAICVLLLLQLLQLFDYLRSNRLLVSYMCDRATNSRHNIGSSLLPRILDTVFRKAVREEDSWQKKLGQYSLVEDFGCTYLNRRGTSAIPVALSDEVRRWIIDKAVKPKAGGFISGVPSPSWWEMCCPGKLSWTLHQETEIHTILIWHIATWFCAKAQDTNEVLRSPEYKVATKLSRYCAYLLAFHQELLPGHHTVTRTIFDTALDEAEHNFKGTTSSNQRYRRMKAMKMEDSYDKGIQDSPDQGILILGVRLGRQLICMDDSGYDIWKIMADFWAEMLLLVAQLGNANAHIEHLAKGGEFVTHLWAFLSNAGIQHESTSIRRNNNDAGNSNSSA